MSSYDYFGMAHFSRNVVLVSDIPEDGLGYARRSISGDVVYIWHGWDRGYEEYQPFVAEWEYTRQSSQVLRQLRYMFSQGGIYWFRLDGLQGYGSFHATDGFGKPDHFSGQKVARSDVYGTRNDQWNGKIKLNVMYSYPLGL